MCAGVILDGCVIVCAGVILDSCVILCAGVILDGCVIFCAGVILDSCVILCVVYFLVANYVVIFGCIVSGRRWNCYVIAFVGTLTGTLNSAYEQVIYDLGSFYF